MTKILIKQGIHSLGIDFTFTVLCTRKYTYGLTYQENNLPNHATFALLSAQ